MAAVSYRYFALCFTIVTVARDTNNMASRLPGRRGENRTHLLSASQMRRLTFSPLLDMVRPAVVETAFID